MPWQVKAQWVWINEVEPDPLRIVRKSSRRFDDETMRNEGRSRQARPALNEEGSRFS
jgi:hypothetical protein